MIIQRECKAYEAVVRVKCSYLSESAKSEYLAFISWNECDIPSRCGLGSQEITKRCIIMLAREIVVGERLYLYRYEREL
jgi:hypothetical protein